MSADIAVPTRYWTDIVPTDGAGALILETNYLYVGVTGNITCLCNGISQLFSNLAVGYHPIRTTRVLATGTTATLIKAAN